MSKTKADCTRRAFMVLGGAAVGATALTGTADAASTHKKLHEAISALKEAREYLDHTPHNFGGHKAEAMEHVGRAIHHLQLCVKY
jgi:hypothetical protein